MQGPMDDAIPSGKKKDKARERLNEFLKDRYPGGVPPVNESHQDAPDKAPAKTKRRKAKKTLRKK